MQLLDPAGLQPLVQVQRQAQIAIGRQQMQGGVTHHVKAKGANRDRVDSGAQGLKRLGRAVGRAGVGNKHQVSALPR